VVKCALSGAAGEPAARRKELRFTQRRAKRAEKFKQFISLPMHGAADSERDWLPRRQIKLFCPFLFGTVGTRRRRARSRGSEMMRCATCGRQSSAPQFGPLRAELD